MRIIVKSDKLHALDDRLDTRVLPRLPIHIICDHSAIGSRLVMTVAKHHPVDTNSVAVVVIEQELPERTVLVRQHKLVDVEYGHPSCFVLEVLAEMRVSASLNGITRCSHDAAFVAIFAKDVSDGNLAVVVVKIKVINAVDQIVCD